MRRGSFYILTKTIFREIRHGLGRYLAIVCIIALGSGFFTGLNVTHSDMMETLNRYLNDTSFYDYRLLSTLGWDEASIEAVQNTEGVALAEGSVSADFLATVNGGERVIKALTLTERVNTPVLTEGRLPQTANECVIDSYSIGGVSVGDTITVSPNNDTDTLDLFAYDTYTVVGAVRSPLYINFERGTSKLGNGTVSCFILLPRAGFDTDVDTELYITLTERAYVYSDAYDALTETAEPIVTDAAEKAALDRFASVKADAQKELDDANAEYADGLREYEDGLKEYEDGLQEYEDGLKEYEDGLQEYEDGLQEYEDGKAELEKNRTSVNKKLNNTKKTLDETEATLKEQRPTAVEAVESLTQTVALLKDAIAELKANRAAVETDPTLDEETRAQMLAQLDAAIAEQTANLTAAEAGLAQAQQGLAAIDDGLKQVKAGREELSKARKTAKRSFAKAEQELRDAEQELQDAKTELEDAERELLDANQELEDAEKELADAREELLDAEKELADAQKEIDDLEEPEVYVLGRDTNVGYVCYESDADIVRGVSKVFPLFFFAVAALVCLTTMNRFVGEERGQLGIFKALGYSSAAIMGRYFFYSGSAAILGCALGTVVGSIVFPSVIWQAYMIMYSMPQITLQLDAAQMLLSGGCYLLLCLLVTYFSCRIELKEPAAELIRPKSPPPGKRILLERIGFIWKKLDFLMKVSLRNVFRYEKRLIMMVLGIGGCTALLLTGFGLNDSITRIADRQYGEISLYDASVSFSEDMTDQEEAFLAQCGDSVARYAFLRAATVTCATDAATGSVQLCGVEDFASLTGLMDMHDGSVPVPAPEKGSCVISSNLSDRYGLGVGDTITVSFHETDALKMTIVGVFDNVIYNYIYTLSETVLERGYEEDFEEKLAYLSFPEGMDVHAAGAVITGADNVTSVTLSADMLTRVNSMLDSMKYVVLLVILCAAALAFIVLFNLTNINIIERVREIATIKVLGFFPGETSLYVFRENLILTFCGCLAGIPMGIWLHNYVISQIKVDMICFDAIRYPISYILSILLTFAFTVAVNLMMNPRLNRVNMAEALKSVE